MSKARKSSPGPRRARKPPAFRAMLLLWPTLGALVTLLLWGGTALADEPSTSPRSHDEVCVDVEIGGKRTPDLDCLSRKLKRQADRAAPLLPAPSVDATSPPERVGGFNETAVGQQYGKNFGKSAQPFRPTPPPASPPLR
jgi:hypothetical protein